jgi:hypothetical protein
VVGHPRPDEGKLRLGLSADEVLEIFVSKADQVICQPYTGGEIGAEVADESFIQTGHCCQIGCGNGPWQCGEACTKSADIPLRAYLISGVFQLLPEYLLEILAVWAKIVERPCRFGSGIIECIPLHPRVPARQMVKVIDPSLGGVTPNPSHVRGALVLGESGNFDLCEIVRKVE